MERKMSKLKVLVFDLYVSSLSCGYKKPNVKGLKDIADFFNATPDEMLMTGDDLRDVKVAKNFGCQSTGTYHSRSIRSGG